jgi:Ca-activated chloride channel family protein
MGAQDFTAADGSRIDRLTAVKQVLGDFLQRRDGDRVGLVVFGDAAFVQAPFTRDLAVVRQLLEETAVRMAGPKTAFGDAIGLAITLFERSKLEQRVMIILTDGNDTGSQVPPAEAAAIAGQRGIVIHTVAIGDPGSVGEEALDEEALKAVAAATGGSYYFAKERDSLEGVYAALDKLEVRKVESLSYRPRTDLFHWPLGAALLLVLAYHLLMAWLAGRRWRSAGEFEQQANP